MISKVAKFMKRNGMPEENAGLIVGLSGGADSVVLLHILQKLGYNCIAAHCNFHLRGNESMRDEQFSASYAASLEVPFFKTDFNTKDYASEHKISIEMAAREQRYLFFEELRKEKKAEAIAIAHHRDDSIETFFINLNRGTGLDGITGIKPCNGKIIRPLLCISRKEILEYAEQNNLKFITDSTNLESKFIRNKIRNEIIPMFESINPSFRDTITQTMENLREVSYIYDHVMVDYCYSVFSNTHIRIDRLKQTPSPEAVLFHILKNYGFTPDIIREIAGTLDDRPGRIFYSPQYRLTTGRKNLEITKKKRDKPVSYYIMEKDSTPDTPLKLSIEIKPYNTDFQLIKHQNIAYFDIDKLHFPLTLRKWKHGDRFIPFGMKGSQKLSDFFNNNKFSLGDKENTWILCSGNDICWIMGHRPDDRFRMSTSTKRVYIVKLL